MPGTIKPLLPRQNMYGELFSRNGDHENGNYKVVLVLEVARLKCLDLDEHIYNL